MSKTDTDRLEGLVIRKHADTRGQERVVRYDPETGEKRLVNPATPGDDHEPWPLLGITLEAAPQETTISTTLLAEGVAAGWITAENQRAVVRPAGATQDVLFSGQTGQPHMFVHCDRVIFHTLDGHVAYRVTHQPDKYAATGDDDTPVTPEVYAAGETRVDHFYRLTKEA